MTSGIHLRTLLVAASILPSTAYAQTQEVPALPAQPGAPIPPAQPGSGSAENTETTGISAEGVGAQGGDAKAQGAAGEIVVTATRRAQNLQDIPIAISAIGSEALETQRITNVQNLQGVVPGLQVNRNNAVVTFTLRGVGSNFRVQGVDTTVAAHTDGVYISSPNALVASFFDVDRIEVVKGPQGVLYGRNASGGAVNIISKLPSKDLSGYVMGSYGNYDAYEGEAVISGPIVEDKVLFRIGGYLRGRDGFGRNLFLDTPEEDLDERGGKATLQLKPTPGFEVILRGDYYKADDHNNGTNAYPGRTRPNTCLPFAPCAPGLTLAETRGGVISPRPHFTNGNIETQRDLEVYGFSGEANLEVADRVTLKSITAYRHIDSFQEFDQDTTRLSINDPFRQAVKGGQFSQELQAHYKGEGVYGILGGYFFKEKRDVSFFLGSPSLTLLPSPPNARDLFQIGYTKTRAFAVFGNADIDITPDLTLGVGARYSSEKRGTAGINAAIFGPAVNNPLTEKTFNAFTPRATISYEASPETTLYASVSRGFKSGQFGVAIPIGAEPEFLWDYEGGVKGRLFGNRLRYTAGAFYYDFKNIQLQLFRGPINVITNAPAAEAYGLEASFELALPYDFRIHADAIYERSKYKGLITDNPNTGELNANLSGNRFPYTPTFSYNVAVEKTVQWGSVGSGTFRIEDQYNSDIYLDIYQNRTNGFRKANHIFNASYRHEINDRTSVLLWGRNIFDKTIPLATNFGFGLFGNTRLVNFNPPRTYGVSVRYDY